MIFQSHKVQPVLSPVGYHNIQCRSQTQILKYPLLISISTARTSAPPSLLALRYSGALPWMTVWSTTEEHQLLVQLSPSDTPTPSNTLFQLSQPHVIIRRILVLCVFIQESLNFLLEEFMILILHDCLKLHGIVEQK